MLLIAALISLSSAGQEYYQQIPIKTDSVYEGSIRLLGYLQLSGNRLSDESARNYRDSLMNVLIKTDSFFKAPAAMYRVDLPHPAFRLIADISWNDYKLSANKEAALANMKRLALAYPAEHFIQGNLALAWELQGNIDSADHIITRFLAAHPEGFTSNHLQKRIILYKRNKIKPGEIVNLGSDSFSTWLMDSIIRLPAAVDSLRNAVATTLVHRAGIKSNDDPLIAQLIMDYADITAKDKAYLVALPFYDEAVKYDSTQQTLAATRRDAISELDKSVSDTFKWATVIYAVPLLAFAFIVIIYLKNRNRQPGGDENGIS